MSEALSPLNESEEALLEKVISGDLAVHSLEKSLSSTQQNNSPSPQTHHDSPFELAVRLRRGWLQHETSFDPCALPYQGLDYASIHGACAEMVVGYVPLPVGVAGPLLLNGELLQLPMATVEGTLIASTRRGCKAITESGGASAVVMQHMMSRAPVLLFPSAMRAAAFKEWMEDPKQADTISTHFNGTSRFANFQSVRVTVAGKYAYARFCCSTGDAMGMNMISKAVNAVLDFVHNEHFNDMQILGLSGNMCCDKKPAAVNWVEGRGCSVVVEATIRGDVVQKVLKTSVDAVVQLNNAKNLVGSAMAGMASGGYNAHAANIVAAIFIATGQDPAQVVESANCITLLTPSENGEDLHISCTMPSIEVGTVGGGTHLAPQKACLELLGVAGASTDKPGGNARKLAMIIASAVMAAELSLLSALVQGHLIRAHMQYNRKAPSASETKAAD